MDIGIMLECSKRSLADTITFPEVVAKLLEGGVERYLADLIGCRKTHYGVKDEIYLIALPIPDAPTIAANFDASEVKNALADIQGGRIGYQPFLRRIMSAGCCHYEVFLTGKKAIYFGRDGSHHIEVFPQAKP